MDAARSIRIMGTKCSHDPPSAEAKATCTDALSTARNQFVRGRLSQKLLWTTVQPRADLTSVFHTAMIFWIAGPDAQSRLLDVLAVGVASFGRICRAFRARNNTASRDKTMRPHSKTPTNQTPRQTACLPYRPVPRGHGPRHCYHRHGPATHSTDALKKAYLNAPPRFSQPRASGPDPLYNPKYPMLIQIPRRESVRRRSKRNCSTGSRSIDARSPHAPNQAL